MLLTFFKEFNILLLERFFINDYKFIKKIELFVEVRKEGEKEMNLLRSITVLSFLNKFKKKFNLKNEKILLLITGKEIFDYFIFFMYLLQDSRVDLVFKEESNSILLQIKECVFLEEIIPIILMKDIVSINLEVFFTGKQEISSLIDILRFCDNEESEEEEE